MKQEQEKMNKEKARIMNDHTLIGFRSLTLLIKKNYN